MARPEIVIVLVPGGLGTKLSLCGIDVWDPDAGALHLIDAVRMILSPALLLPWLALQPQSLTGSYDETVAFLKSRDYVEGQNLFLYGYDWRLGMDSSAAELASFVSSRILPALGNRKLLFIAHSFGCMVVRWALLFGFPSNPSAPMIPGGCVERVIAAGPPMLGVASSFRDMVEMPSLQGTFDELFAALKAVLPDLAAQVQAPLNKSLMAVTSELHSMPPNQVPILQGGADPPGQGPYGVLDWSGWPIELVSLLASVKSVQDKLAATPWGSIPCTVIASQSHATDTGYVLDSDNRFHSALPPGPGDDNVLIQSALAYCPHGARVIVESTHRGLLDDQETRNYFISNNIL